LDGGDVLADNLRDRNEAGIHRRAIDQHRAGAALAFAATFLRPRQAALLAQDVEQPGHGMDPRKIETDAPAVQRELHDISFSGVAGISRTSKPACRSAFATAGAGPSIGISPTPFAPNGPCVYGRSSTTTSMSGVSSVVGTM